jgi:hypothetical protein
MATTTARGMLTVDIVGSNEGGETRRIGAGSVVEILARSGDLYTVRREGFTGVVRFYDLLPL